MKQAEGSPLRKEILDHAKKAFHTEPEYLWKNFPGYAVLRHPDNNKWYAILMDVEKEKLGLSGNTRVDILDIKTDPVFGASLRTQPGFLPGYHMQKENWITVLLDGSVDLGKIVPLLEMSYHLTESRKPADRQDRGNDNV